MNVGFFLAAPTLWKDNIYPLFTWKVFEIYPVKYRTTREVYIWAYAGRKFDPPILVRDTKTLFAEVYDRRHDLGSREFESWRDERRLSEYVAFTRSIFRQRRGYARWEIRETTVDVVDYFLKNKILKQRTLGFYEFAN